MNNRFGKRRVTSLLLVLAMLVVSVVSLLPMTASADPVGAYASDIQDFGWQSLSDATQNDVTTDLRFLFTIGSLDYDEVGFVFSTSNSAPTAGGTGTFTSTVVYSSVTANGKTYNADPGRFWVAVKLSSIPLANFEDTIYIRPFIKVGENYSYIDAASIDVLTALTLDKVGAAEDSIYDSKNPSGSYASNGAFRFDKQISSIRGSEHFYPDESNGNAGNDLWFEYSVLFNDSLNNYDVYNCASEIKTFGFVSGNYSKHSEFYYLYGMNYADRTGDKKGKTGDKCSPDCKFRGHFDYSTYASASPGQNCADDLTALGNTLFGDAVGRYAAGWEGARTDSPYVYDDTWTTKGGNGWHRLGFRFHQEVASVAGDTVTYSGYSELYINGTLVWRVHSDTSKLETNGLLLWEAKTTAADGFVAGANGLYYKDNDTMRVQYRMDSVANSTNSVYVGIADVCWTCGDDFAHPVSPATLNVDGTVELGGNDYSTKIWYIYDN